MSIENEENNFEFSKELLTEIEELFNEISLTLNKYYPLNNKNFTNSFSLLAKSFTLINKFLYEFDRMQNDKISSLISIYNISQKFYSSEYYQKENLKNFSICNSFLNDIVDVVDSIIDDYPTEIIFFKKENDEIKGIIELDLERIKEISRTNAAFTINEFRKEAALYVLDKMSGNLMILDPVAANDDENQENTTDTAGDNINEFKKESALSALEKISGNRITFDTEEANNDDNEETYSEGNNQEDENEVYPTNISNKESALLDIYGITPTLN